MAFSRAVVGAGSWGCGAGGGGAVRLLLVLSGCLVCGSGTTRQQLPRGRVPSGLYLEKWGVFPGAACYSAEWRGCTQRKKLHCRRMGVGTEGSAWGGLVELLTVGRSMEPFDRDWKGGLDWVRSGPGGCVALHRPRVSWLKKKGDLGTVTGRHSCHWKGSIPFIQQMSNTF